MQNMPLSSFLWAFLRLALGTQLLLSLGRAALDPRRFSIKAHNHVRDAKSESAARFAAKRMWFDMELLEPIWLKVQWSIEVL